MEYKIIEGSIPIMISAPHATKHYRNYMWKQADQNTDVLARAIQKHTDCHVIYRINENQSDPNDDEFTCCAYKQALLAYIKEHDIQILIDLHGSKYEREFLVELGTIDDQDSSLHERKWISKIMMDIMKKQLKEQLLRYNKVISKNKVFKASKETTITNSISKRSNCSCIQVEINSYLRCFDEIGFNTFITTMIEVVDNLKRYL